MYAIWFFNGCMVLLALMLGASMAFAWKLGKSLERHRRGLDEISAMVERVKIDAHTVLDKIEDVCAEQIQHWNAAQKEAAALGARLAQVERRFGPLAPASLEQRVDEAPETGPDGPVPVEQEPADGR